MDARKAKGRVGFGMNEVQWRAELDAAIRENMPKPVSDPGDTINEIVARLHMAHWKVREVVKAMVAAGKLIVGKRYISGGKHLKVYRPAAKGHR